MWANHRAPATPTGSLRRMSGHAGAHRQPGQALQGFQLGAGQLQCHATGSWSAVSGNPGVPGGLWLSDRCWRLQGFSPETLVVHIKACRAVRAVRVLWPLTSLPRPDSPSALPPSPMVMWTMPHLSLRLHSQTQPLELQARSKQGQTGQLAGLLASWCI